MVRKNALKILDEQPFEGMIAFSSINLQIYKKAKFATTFEEAVLKPLHIGLKHVYQFGGVNLEGMIKGAKKHLLVFCSISSNKLNDAEF